MNHYRPFRFFYFVAIFLWGPTAYAGNILGTITESVGSTPLSGIDLDLFDSNFNSVALNASTDGAGNYTFAGLAAGNYYV
ncbi:MAG: hypothetical protein KC964_26045, partial [Candidatus Omnitrophica bacterium]|nr:hypothetical protein [Candidatus Omnitrophota bacterium]